MSQPWVLKLMGKATSVYSQPTEDELTEAYAKGNDAIWIFSVPGADFKEVESLRSEVERLPAEVDRLRSGDRRLVTEADKRLDVLEALVMKMIDKSALKIHAQIAYR